MACDKGYGTWWAPPVLAGQSPTQPLPPRHITNGQTLHFFCQDRAPGLTPRVLVWVSSSYSTEVFPQGAGKSQHLPAEQNTQPTQPQREVGSETLVGSAIP